jgi:Fe2+ or Zn2+ uptake regulation protein
MEDQESEALLLQVMEKHHFQIDEGKTVLFGQCENCFGQDPEDRT